MSSGRVLLKAIYSYKNALNDELNFKKGDIITLTQKEDGGWWEGTLNGKTGWFPENYVQAIQADEAPDLNQLPGDVTATQVDYRQQVIKDLLAKEQEFVSDMGILQQRYLQPLSRSDMLSDTEFRQLAGNIDEVIDVHRSMNLAIEETTQLSPRNQKLGKVFLQHGSNIKAAHRTYWQNHPKAVCVLEKYREKLDKFMEAYGASQPGLMALTTALSKPFRHLEKYPGVAQEVEQHFEDDHPDRGDTQRSIGFYKSVASECAKLRRQKELELEVLTGTIRDWEGESIHNMGDIVHMGSVAVGKDHQDRYLILFPQNLLILSVSSRMSAFIYQGKLPLSGIAVNRLEDMDTIMNAFEITGPMIDRIVVVCQSKGDSQHWVDLLQSQIKQARKCSSSMQSYPAPPPHVSSRQPFNANSCVECPPYVNLTRWIRHALVEKRLTFAQIREMSNPNRKRKNVERFMLLNPCSEVKTRGQKPLCRVATRCQDECRPREQPYPNELNPFLTRSSTTSSVSEIFFAVDGRNSSGETTSSVSSFLESPLPSGGCTPVKQLDLTQANWGRLGEVASVEDQVQRRSMLPTPFNRLLPPVTSLRHTNSDVGIRRAPFPQQQRRDLNISFKWIDKTPSEQSLNVPFCPPTLVDYDEFGKLVSRPSSKVRRLSKQVSLEAEMCVIEPMENVGKIASTHSTPMPSRRSSRISYMSESDPIHHVRVETPMTNVKEVTTLDLNLDTATLGKNSHSSSSDSGLGDICKRFSASKQSQPSLAPNPYSCIDDPNVIYRVPTMGNHLMVKELNESLEENDEEYEHFSSGHNDVLWRLRRVPFQRQRSQELLLPPKSPSIALLNPHSNEFLFIDEDEPIPDGGVYKNCLYAHWWMKAELPPLLEEDDDDEPGPCETWV